MKVHKFGGASIKDVSSIKKITKIIQKEGIANGLLVISAMGKMTNALENIVNLYVNNQRNELSVALQEIVDFHLKIINNLFEKEHEIYQKVDNLFAKIDLFIATNNSKNYDYIYDQIVCFGELLSTSIISSYLNQEGIVNTWKDVRELIKTNDVYRDAKVLWDETNALINSEIDSSKMSIVQGFIASGHDGQTTTLGREGSDYTAGIFAYCLEAENVTIWKDVEGVLNADPRVFKETQLLTQISYEETIEMAFYGASVIHPKTIQPIQKKEIPLYVRSFNNLDSQGTKVSRGTTIDPLVPCFIVKKNQVLVSISSLDFSFIVEKNISFIFKLLDQYQLKVNLIQNSAISFSFCVDDAFDHFDAFYHQIKSFFKISFFKDVDLFTIRYFTENSMKQICNQGKPLLTQTNKDTVQIVIQKNK